MLQDQVEHDTGNFQQISFRLKEQRRKRGEVVPGDSDFDSLWLRAKQDSLAEVSDDEEEWSGCLSFRHR